jgi:hypothetical protein
MIARDAKGRSDDEPPERVFVPRIAQQSLKSYSPSPGQGISDPCNPFVSYEDPAKEAAIAAGLKRNGDHYGNQPNSANSG